MSWPGTSRRVSFSTTIIRRLRSTRLRTARLLGAVAAVSLVAAACGGSNPAALQDTPGTTRQQLISDRNNPAVQLIVTQYKATVTAPSVGVDDGALNALGEQVGQQAVAGQIASDQNSLLDAIVNGIAANPGAYFTAGAPVQAPATATFQCTGSVVTPDGYIVTAAHCTQPAPDDLQQAYVQTGLKPILDATIQGIEQSGSGLTADQKKKLADAAATFVAGKAQVSGETKSIFTGLFSSSSSGSREMTKKPLSLVTQGTAPKSSRGPFGEKDVSILKLDGYGNLPTAPITSDADVSSGQPLYVDGYPGGAENGNLENLSTPTVTAGSVSARKTSDAGVPLIETTATASGGNSGGPGFDQDGEMIGVVSYGTSSNGASYNYLIGSSVAQQFLREKNIQPRESATTRMYDLALNDYYRHYYKRALPEFQQVKALYPGDQYVDSFIQKSQAAIQQGRDQTPLVDGTALIVVIAGAAAFVLLVGGGVAALLLRRARRRRMRAELGGLPPPIAPMPAPSPVVPEPGWAPGPTGRYGPQPPPDVATVESGGVTWRWDGQRWIPISPPSSE